MRAPIKEALFKEKGVVELKTLKDYVLEKLVLHLIQKPTAKAT